MNTVVKLTQGYSAEQRLRHLYAAQLRQWLAILHELYGKAGWPTTVWPVWMSAPPRPASAPVSTVQLH